MNNEGIKKTAFSINNGKYDLISLVTLWICIALGAALSQNNKPINPKTLNSTEENYATNEKRLKNSNYFYGVTNL